MTCIAGCVDDEQLVIGADSSSTDGHGLTFEARSPKIFRCGDGILGFTTSWRMGQILEHAFKPPTIGKDVSVERYLCTEWIDAVRGALGSAGWKQRDDERDRGGTFLYGFRGRLFLVDAEFQVVEPRDGYAACGSGWQVAWGAMAALRNLGHPADATVRGALTAASKHNAPIRAPFSYLAMNVK
jgi:ATP-dependent protease HslVU (ClpYQ) peptidase subunit